MSTRKRRIGAHKFTLEPLTDAERRAALEALLRIPELAALMALPPAQRSLEGFLRIDAEALARALVSSFARRVKVDGEPIRAQHFAAFTHEEVLAWAAWVLGAAFGTIGQAIDELARTAAKETPS